MLLIGPVTAITMDAERRVIGDAAIAVDGPFIAGVGKASDVWARFPGATRLDGGGRLALPGLIDAHGHADQSLLRGTTDDVGWVPFLRDWIDPWLQQRRPDQLLAAYRLSLLEMVHAGTTCFLSPNVDPTDDLDGLAEVIGSSGLRAVLARWVEPGSLAGAAEAVGRWQGGADGLIQTWFGLMVPRQEGDECVPAFYRAVMDTAAELGAGVAYHFCSEIEDASYYESTFGMRPAEWAAQHGLLGPNVVLINGCWFTPHEIELVAASATSVVYSPTATMKMATGVTPVASLRAAGVNLALGTDGGANNNSHDMIAEMKAGCLVQNITARRAGAVTAEDVLEMATIGGARAIGRSHDLGSLEVGKRADVVLVDLDRPHTVPVTDPVSNLVYAANGGNVDTVLIDGRIVLRDGRATTVDEAAILGEARAAAAGIAGRITPAHRARWPVL
jgi:cytosine/adenosine deaminase-related metal-dependent hydrolase